MECVEKPIRGKRAKPLPPPMYLSAAGLASRLGISLAQAYNLADRGVLPVLRIEGNVRFPIAGVEAYEAANTVPASASRGDEGRRVLIKAGLLADA